MAKNLLASQESQGMWVQSLGGEDPLEEEMATCCSFLPGKFHGQRNLVGCSSWGCKELGTTKQLSTCTHKEWD